MSALYMSVMGLSLVTGVVVRRLLPGTPLPLSSLQKLGVAAGALVGGVLGAKLPYVLGDWSALASGRVWLESGRTLTVGLLGGYAGVEVAKLAFGIRVKTGDALAVPLAASIAVGRIGCFVAGCCHGLPTSLPWGCDFGDGIHRHPTQLYEALFHASAAVVLHRWGREGRYPLQRVKLYIGGYMLFRLATELLRPEPRVALGLTFYQWASLFGIAVMAALFLVDAQRRVPASASADAG
jgi:phosphatidylglycerol---prolipoprotein diacylglyceryl transferase